MPPNILRKPLPHIADVNCSRIHFEPGDRVLVRVYQKLDQGQEYKLRKSIEKWAGVGIEVLIYNAMQMEIHIDKKK